MTRMYVVVNKDLNMSIGKTAAQVAHAVARVKSHDEPQVVIVLEGTTEQLHNLHDYLKDQSIKSYLYIDEGVNEIPAYSVTALAVEAFEEVNLDRTELFEGFKLLSNKRKLFK